MAFAIYLVCAVLLIALVVAHRLVDHGALGVGLAVLDVVGLAALVEDRVALADKLGGGHRDVVAPAPLALGLALLPRAEYGDRVAVLIMGVILARDKHYPRVGYLVVVSRLALLDVVDLALGHQVVPALAAAVPLPEQA